MGKSTFSKMKIFDFFKNENFHFFQKKLFREKMLDIFFKKVWWCGGRIILKLGAVLTRA